MKQRKKNAFTLIELIATLVIMAIIALIATPLVMNIIRSARVAADKRSVDAYGRSIELAIAGYLLDNGRFPTQISDLTIEYSGNEVVCEQTKLNSDSSVYLAGCTVAGRSTGDYTYGTEEVITYDAYNVGDEVTYNNVDYRVIKDSSASEASVTLLKAEPLSVTQVNQYGGVGTAYNHVNMYVTSDTNAAYYQTAYNQNGYGGMAYYSSATCGGSDDSGCTTDYIQSDIKYVVDAWKAAEAPAATESRLIQYSEFESLGYEWVNFDTSGGVNMGWRYTNDVPSWIGNSSYWTMSPYPDSMTTVRKVEFGGSIYHGLVWNNYRYAVRPVIVLPKSALSS